MKTKQLKKWQMGLLALLCLVTLTACQSKSEPTKESSPTKTTESTKESTEKAAVDWPYYEISQDGKTVGHILGTMHVGKKEMYPFPTKMLDDVAASSLLLTEIKMKDLQEPDAEMLMAAIQGDEPLTEGMTPESIAVYRKRLAEYGYKEEDMATLNRFGVDQFLQTKYFSPLAGTYGVEMQLYGRTKNFKGVKNVGFETVEEQYDILLSTYEDLADVNEWVQSIPTLKEGKAASAKLVEAYINGEVFDYFTEETLTDSEKAQMTVIIDQRNENWLKVLPSYLTIEKGVFVAVGAGHLPGQKGVLALLEQAGYETKKVIFD